ncbi:MAG: hypothetical protein ACTHMJ_01030 [Thermomicrobiales bacterium]
MMYRIKAIILGIGHDPRVVGAARALAFYALPLVVEWLVGYLAGLPPHWAAVFVPEIPLIRALEGALLDQLKKPTQNAPFPMPPAGAGAPPADVISGK